MPKPSAGHVHKERVDEVVVSARATKRKQWIGPTSSRIWRVDLVEITGRYDRRDRLPVTRDDRTRSHTLGCINRIETMRGQVCHRNAVLLLHHDVNT